MASSFKMLIQSDWLLGAIFLVCAILIWIFGIRLAKAVDTIVHHYGWGEAIGGIVFLAIITNLPEIAITTVAAYKHEYDIAVSNILGGIAIQTVVLVLIDAFGVGRKAPLTHKGHSNILMVEGWTVIIILGTVLLANQIPITHKILRATPYEWLITGMWIGSIFWTKHLYNKHALKKPRKISTVDFNTSTILDKFSKSTPTGIKRIKKVQPVSSAILIVIIGAMITLFAGYGLELSGEILSKRWGISGVLFGSTILAFCTALPEISTGIASAKIRDYEMAVSDIFGGNAFLPSLFLMAALISGDSILPSLQFSDIYLTYVGIGLTLVYIIGMNRHSKRQYFNLGIDSIVVLVLYILSIVGLVYI